MMQIGFAGLLTIVFIVLKLTEVISWSWLWVLAPMWMGFLFWITIVFGMIGYVAWKDYKWKNRNRVKN